jgi:hypothetical protein
MVTELTAQDGRIWHNGEASILNMPGANDVSVSTRQTLIHKLRDLGRLSLSRKTMSGNLTIPQSGLN